MRCGKHAVRRSIAVRRKGGLRRCRPPAGCHFVEIRFADPLVMRTLGGRRSGDRCASNARRIAAHGASVLHRDAFARRHHDEDISFVGRLVERRRLLAEHESGFRPRVDVLHAADAHRDRRVARGSVRAGEAELIRRAPDVGALRRHVVMTVPDVVLPPVVPTSTDRRTGFSWAVTFEKAAARACRRRGS